mmetsp:Transcript_30067/g.94743  ORF Transcript_30067/g.94743 Transcript_30067/m.94743 type:complete len:473 (-) Transcript_30067:135-1553(-)
MSFPVGVVQPLPPAEAPKGFRRANPRVAKRVEDENMQEAPRTGTSLDSSRHSSPSQGKLSPRTSSRSTEAFAHGFDHPASPRAASSRTSRSPAPHETEEGKAAVHKGKKVEPDVGRRCGRYLPEYVLEPEEQMRTRSWSDFQEMSFKPTAATQDSGVVQTCPNFNSVLPPSTPPEGGSPAPTPPEGRPNRVRTRNHVNRRQSNDITNGRQRQEDGGRNRRIDPIHFQTDSGGVRLLPVDLSIVGPSEQDHRRRVDPMNFNTDPAFFGHVATVAAIRAPADWPANDEALVRHISTTPDLTAYIQAVAILPPRTREEHLALRVRRHRTPREAADGRDVSRGRSNGARQDRGQPANGPARARPNSREARPAQGPGDRARPARDNQNDPAARAIANLVERHRAQSVGPPAGGGIRGAFSRLRYRFQQLRSFVFPEGIFTMEEIEAALTEELVRDAALRRQRLRPPQRVASAHPGGR